MILTPIKLPIILPPIRKLVASLPLKHPISKLTGITVATFLQQSSIASKLVPGKLSDILVSIRIAIGALTLT
jgi:hypothetical protein